MRLFKTLLFMGMGDTSKELSYVLHERLEKALALNCAAQQGYILSTEQRENLEDTVKDFAAALLGRKITLGKKLDYPAKDAGELPQAGPPSNSEVNRVMSWASCVDCSSQLTMTCPTCVREALKQAIENLEVVNQASFTLTNKVEAAMSLLKNVRRSLRISSHEL